MQLIRGLHNLRDRHGPCALTIGNFDGVHRGHRAVLEQLRAVADGLPTTLMTFEPHPREFFHPANAPLRITGLAEKLTRLAGAGVDRVVVVRFDARFAALGADVFVDDIIARRLRARCVVVGDDFRFGHRSAGDFELLRSGGARLGFAVRRRETVMAAGERISSSRIRQCLAEGDLDGATALLGAPYCIQGRVVQGRRLGRTLGFPTANIRLDGARPPISGVFAVRVMRPCALTALPGVANVGRRPTVSDAGAAALQLEVHLFDQALDLYGERLRVELVARLRAERKFASLDALREQIARDAAAARALLGSTP